MVLARGCHLLDGGLESSLKWEVPREEGKILYHLDLGLFDRLKFPLEHQAQFQSLALAVEQFVDTVWLPRRNRTLGVLLYQGTLDFSSLVGGSYLDARDRCYDFLNTLAKRIPDKLPACLSFRVPESMPALQVAQLISADLVEHFTLFLNGCPFPHAHGIWDKDDTYHFPQIQDALPATAILFPPASVTAEEAFAPLEPLFTQLHNTPYRLINEEHLTEQWHGLDHLYVSESGLTPQGRRKLQGFQAAGGTLTL
ncbi:MAG: hypothetical protein KDK65_06150, partial [Chlamydiia bacterium]|nr:hypothetical protein [Chlamydiia bacterium]